MKIVFTTNRRAS